MEVKAFSEFLDDRYLMDTIDVNPSDGGFVLEGKTFLNRSCFFLFKMRFIIVNDGNFLSLQPSSPQCARASSREDLPLPTFS